MTQQTAVDWLKSVTLDSDKSIPHSDLEKLFEQAKKMEKELRESAWKDGVLLISIGEERQTQKNKVTVILKEELGKDPTYFVKKNGEFLKCFTFKDDVPTYDPIWGRTTALSSAMSFAKSIENVDSLEKETVIYETPNPKTE